MALTLPKAKTLTISATDTDGNTDKIELTTKVAQMNPTLMVPSVLDLIRNTSVSPSSSMAENTRIYGMDKNVYVDIVDGSGTFKDPRSMTTEERNLLVKQLTPVMVGAKYGNVEWDGSVEGLQDVLGRALGQHVEQRRVIKEQSAFTMALTAAVAEQAKIVAATAGATTFAKGAHVVKETIASSDDAYASFKDSVSNFQRIGLDSAPEATGKAYKHAVGIGKQDILVLMTPEFEAEILSKPGVFASESGNSLFREAGIKRILGVDCTSNITLPAGVNYMIITTGINGAISHEQISVGTTGKILIDPNWSYAKRLDLVDAFTLGVVYPFQIFVSKVK